MGVCLTKVRCRLRDLLSAGAVGAQYLSEVGVSGEML